MYWITFWIYQVIPEWHENWRAFPHCNGQARCWMHCTTPPAPWCRCSCRWCRIARLIRKDGRRQSRRTRTDRAIRESIGR